MIAAGCSLDATPAPVITAAATPVPTPVTTAYQLDATAWYAGLVINIDSATSVIDEGGGFVDVDIRLENPGADVATLGVPIQLDDGSQTVEPVRGTVVPDIEAGGSVAMTIQFDVDGTFDVAAAAVRIGRPEEHVVIVPFIESAQPRVTLDPVPLALAGKATAGALTVTLTSGEIRADIPDWALELPADTLALTVFYSARYRGTFAGGFAFTGANVGLSLPDGSVVSARADGHSQSTVVLKPAVTVPNLLARFDVPDPGTGTYSLIVRDGSKRSSIPFTIKPRVPGG
ncbi:MAG: hypothetical protein HYX54_03565 [Chloroflexi bacterium]|nr:hypothetical protein [Chloroflexota bacterium]